MAELIVKRGESFVHDCVRRNQNGASMSLAGVTVQSFVKTQDDSFSQALTITIGDQAARPGSYRVVGDSSSWPLGDLRWQTRFLQAGQMPFTQERHFTVAEGQSNAAVVQPYVHTQTDASAEWIVNHNLGRKPAGVEVLTPGGASILADVRHISNDQFRVYLAVPATGNVTTL